MQKNELILFGPSGCISREAMLAWAEGRLSAEERMLIQQHSDECIFCHEALEGLTFCKSKNLGTAFSALDQSFDKLIETHKPKTHSRRIVYFSVAAAACLLAVFGIISLMRYLNTGNQLLVAQHSESPVPVVKKDSLANQPELQSAKANEKPQTHIVTPHPAPSGIQSVPSSSETAVALSAPPEIKAEEEVAELKEAKPSTADKANADLKMEKSEAAKPSAESYVSKKKDVAFTAGEKKMASPVAAAQRSVQGSDDTEFYIVDQPPRFQGGDAQRFANYISYEYQKLKNTPKEGITEDLIITFTISSEGRLMNAHIIKKVEPSLDSTIMEIIRKAPDWEPGKQNGKPVKVRLNVTLNLNR